VGVFRTARRLGGAVATLPLARLTHPLAVVRCGEEGLAVLDVDLPSAVVDESVVVSAEEDAGSTTITGRVS